MQKNSLNITFLIFNEFLLIYSKKTSDSFFIKNSIITTLDSNSVVIITIYLTNSWYIALLLALYVTSLISSVELQFFHGVSFESFLKFSLSFSICVSNDTLSIPIVWILEFNLSLLIIKLVIIAKLQDTIINI